MRIWINAGEASGDLHGALLAEKLRERAPDVDLVGMAGPAMREAGVKPLFRVEALSVMGLTEVFGHLPKILGLLRGIKRELRVQRPDALVCIDAQAFNFRVINMARALDIPVYYYISPKLWAWRPGRAKFIRDNVRRMLCILPFEKEFYRQYGLEVDYVGNPLLDGIDWPSLNNIQRDTRRIGILPGSRKKEIRPLLPQFGQAARLLLQKHPSLQFDLIQAPGIDKQMLLDLWPADVPVNLHPPSQRYQRIRASNFVIAASGTVTLECALLGTPAIVAYKLSALTFGLAKHFIHVRYISLPNLILDKGVLPEMLQEQADAEPLARLALSWLDDTALLEEKRRDLARLHSLLGRRGAPLRAADIILADLEGRPVPSGVEL